MEASKGKSVLGKGLGALISGLESEPVSVRDASLSVDDGKRVNVLVNIDVKRIHSNRFQPRTDFDIEKLEELKASILSKGIIQPITVHRMGDGTYELIAGERRLRAAILAGLQYIPAYILEVTSEAELLELALIENLQREDLNPIEEAQSYQRLITECQLTHEEIARRIGKDRSTITNMLRLLKLPKEIQESLRRNEITTGHARALINLPTERAQLALWRKSVAKGYSVRQVEALVRSLERGKKKSAIVLKYNAVSNVESRLKRLLGTQVKIRMSKEGKGKIVIEFYSQDDFDRLLELLERIEKYR
ncbi:MAG: ParB/RepB/Spo0J family partition protein [Bacteroidota bacterium]